MNQLDGIDVFVKVVQSGSFSQAARLLNMPVTTVSGKVAALEKRLGMTLLHRTTRKLNVTEAGEAYFHHCVRALEAVNAGEKEILTARKEPEGLLKITAPPDIGHLILPHIIRDYLKAYPKTKVELMLTNRMVDLVGEGVDLALRAGALKDSTLIARKFVEMEVSLWASSAYVKKNGLPKNPKDLKDHSFIAFQRFGNSMTFSKEKQSIEVTIDPRIIVDDIEAIKVFIDGNDGIGFLSPWICEPEIASGKFVRVLPGLEVDLGFGSRGLLSFVYPPQRFVPPKIHAFVEMATSACRQHAKKY